MKLQKLDKQDVIIEQQSQLTPRELEVLKLFRLGHSYRSAGEVLGIASATVKKHSVSIYKKLNCKSKTQALYQVFKSEEKEEITIA